jgi:hypothetical protein
MTSAGRIRVTLGSSCRLATGSGSGVCTPKRGHRILRDRADYRIAASIDYEDGPHAPATSQLSWKGHLPAERHFCLNRCHTPILHHLLSAILRRLITISLSSTKHGPWASQSASPAILASPTQDLVEHRLGETSGEGVRWHKSAHSLSNWLRSLTKFGGRAPAEALPPRRSSRRQRADLGASGIESGGRLSWRDLVATQSARRCRGSVFGPHDPVKRGDITRRPDSPGE